MKICAVICEYDPFHSGHKHQIDKLKNEGYAVVAIMSGSFTQRGTAATISKYDRAESAVKCGADLVLELPFPYCASGASVFAAGGVHIARSLGVVDFLAFGSEQGDSEMIKTVAENMLSEEFYSALKSEKADFGSYSQRCISTYEKLYGKSPVLEGSNDLLALEYVKAIMKTNSEIKPLAVKREGQAYGRTSGEGFLSASSVRKMIYSGDKEGIRSAVPAPSAEAVIAAMDCGGLAMTEKLFLPYAAHFRLSYASLPSETAEMTDELFGRLIASARSARSFDELISGAQTKMYSESRIRRAMLFSLLGVKASDITKPAFSVLLGAGKTGREILAKIKKTSDFPIITKPADYTLFGEGARRGFEMLMRAESLWTLALSRPDEAGALMRKNPYIAGE